MGNIVRIAVVLLLASFLLSWVYAQEEAPSYNFGTMQVEKSINLEPGESYTSRIYVYNIYGNRITHVSFSVAEAPPGWEIVLDPDLHTITTNISGELINVQENLYAEPASIAVQVPDFIPGDMEYIEAGGVEGYIPAKVLNVIINVPESTPLGNTYVITINAKATWRGQGGMVVLSQDRNFDFTVKTVTRRFTEEIVKETTVPDNVEETDVSTQTPFRYVIIGGVGAILMLALLYGILSLIRKKN